MGGDEDEDGGVAGVAGVAGAPGVPPLNRLNSRGRGAFVRGGGGEGEGAGWAVAGGNREGSQASAVSGGSGERLGLVGVSVDRGGNPSFYCSGRREGYVKIEEGLVVVYQAFLLRETLKAARFTWDPGKKVWKMPLNQALRVLKVKGDELDDASSAEAEAVDMLPGLAYILHTLCYLVL